MSQIREGLRWFETGAEQLAARHEDDPSRYSDLLTVARAKLGEAQNDVKTIKAELEAERTKTLAAEMVRDYLGCFPLLEELASSPELLTAEQAEQVAACSIDREPELDDCRLKIEAFCEAAEEKQRAGQETANELQAKLLQAEEAPEVARGRAERVLQDHERIAEEHAEYEEIIRRKGGSTISEVEQTKDLLEQYLDLEAACEDV